MSVTFINKNEECPGLKGTLQFLLLSPTHICDCKSMGNFFTLYPLKLADQRDFLLVEFFSACLKICWLRILKTKSQETF